MPLENAAKLENAPVLLKAFCRLATLKWLRVLFSALMVLCASTNASANPGVQPKTRVWDFSFAQPLNVWLERAASPRTRLESRSGSLEHASASPHAARGARAAAGPGFRSFSAFKRAMGSAGEGMQWHHVVEQTPGNVARFGGEAIHTTGNLVRLDSSIQDFTGGQTVRQWLGTQSLEAQQQFGLEVLRRFGGAP